MRGEAVAQTDRWGDVDEDEMEEEGEHRIAAELIAGGVAGVASWIGNIPMDVMKSRLQADDLSRRQYANYMDCMRKSYKEGGFRIFWRGLPATCIRAFPVNAVTFATVDIFQRIYKQQSQQHLTEFSGN